MEKEMDMDLEMDLDMDMDMDMEMDLDMDMDMDMEMDLEKEMGLDMEMGLDLEMEMDMGMDLDLEMEDFKKKMNKEIIFNKVLEHEEAYLYDFLKSINLIISTKIPTMGINNNLNLFINPKFVKNLTDDELIFSLYHECMHVIYNHINTKKTNNYLVNVAGDIYINEELISLSYTPPEGIFFKKTYNVPTYIHTAEDIYIWLENNLTNEQKQELQFINNSELENLEENEQKISDEQKKSIDKLRQSLEKKNQEFKKIQPSNPIQWDIDLSHEIGRLIKREELKNYRRPARYEPEGIIRPNNHINISTPKINLYIDKSGSMEHNLSVVISSLLEIKNKLKNYIPTYYAFDTEIVEVQENELSMLESSGGTSFTEIKGNADLHVIITDGELDFDFINSQKNIIVYKIHNNIIERIK